MSLLTMSLLSLVLACVGTSSDPHSDVSVAFTSDGLHVAGLPASSDDGRFVLVLTGPTLREIEVASRSAESEWLIEPVEDTEGAMIVPDEAELGSAVAAIEARRWSTTLDALTRGADGTFTGHGVHVRIERADPESEETMAMLEVSIGTETIRERLDGESIEAVHLASDRSFLLLTLWGCACECGEWPSIVPL